MLEIYVTPKCLSAYSYGFKFYICTAKKSYSSVDSFPHFINLNFV